jgi:hypothetical protein
VFHNREEFNGHLSKYNFFSPRATLYHTVGMKFAVKVQLAVTTFCVVKNIVHEMFRTPEKEYNILINATKKMSIL